MTSPTDKEHRLNVLRGLLRGLHTFRALYEQDGFCEIQLPDGSTWDLFDVEYLYERLMRKPVEIVPTNVVIENLRPGHHLRHLNQWLRVMDVELLASSNALRPFRVTLEDGRRKRFAHQQVVPTISQLQKSALDYEAEHPCLPLGQRRAIQLFFVENMRERDAALLMGVSETNPVGMYAMTGLEQLLCWMDAGKLRFRWDDHYDLADTARSA